MVAAIPEVPLRDKYLDLREKCRPLAMTYQDLAKVAVDPAQINPLEAKSPPLEHIYSDIAHYRTITTDRFLSHEIMERELAELWPRTWLVAGLEMDLAEVGDWFTYDIGRDALLIVRTEPGEVKAFHNVCRHRGNRLARETHGKGAKSFTCGFHSWRWDVKGRIARVTDKDTFAPGALCGNLDLAEAAVQCRAGLVFVSLAPAPMPIDAYLGGILPTLESYQLGAIKLAKDIEIVLPANWKVAMNAFQENYHVHAQHPQAMLRSDDSTVQYDYYPNGHSRMMIQQGVVSPRQRNQNKLTQPIAEMLSDVGLDPADFTERAGDARQAIQKVKRESGVSLGMDYSGLTDSQLTDIWAGQLFPNLTFTAQAESFSILRFRPHPTDPQQTIWNILLLARGARTPRRLELGDQTSTRDRPARHYATLEDTGLYEVLNQDVDAIPQVQLGMNSHTLKVIRLSEQEGRIQQFYAELDLYLDGKK